MKEAPNLAYLAKQHFGIDLPCQPEDLKSCYRQACRKLHPDVGGNEDAFKEMQQAYETLVSFQGKGHNVFTNGDDEILKTVDGFLLSELGQGLGPTTNGKDCPDCEHKGYQKKAGRSWIFCDKCDMYGFASEEGICRACSGSGKFTQARSKRVVTCLRCNGTGKWVNPFRKMLCPYCHGSKTIWDGDETKVYYVKCSACNGTGEIPIWNPVIPKGALKI